MTQTWCGVRYYPESGHKGARSARPLWANNRDPALNGRLANSARVLAESDVPERPHSRGYCAGRDFKASRRKKMMLNSAQCGLFSSPRGQSFMKKILAACIAAAAFCGAPALAADMAVKAPPPAAAYNWTGFYVGGNLGYGWVDPTVSYTPNDTNAFLSTCGNQRGQGTCVPPGNFNMSGAVGGVQAGYNWQLNTNWLLGVEADFDWAGIKGSTNSSFILNSVGPVTFTAAESVENFGTVRARVGFLPFQQLLVYATGGLAYGDVKESVGTLASTGGSNSNGGFGYTCATSQPNCFAGSSSRMIVGGTVGAGSEYMITNNLILRAEYLYVNLGHVSGVNTVATSVAAVPGSTPSSFTANFGTVSFNVLRGGLSWKF
jgi:outer membrane immunogenic protein